MCAWEECKNVGVLLLVVALVKETEDSDVPAQLERGKVVVEKREVFSEVKFVGKTFLDGVEFVEVRGSSMVDGADGTFQVRPHVGFELENEVGGVEVRLCS